MMLEPIPAEHARIARPAIVGGAIHAQLVQTLEVPSDRAARPVDVERVLALGPDHRPADLERPAGATGELAQHARVVLVGDRRARIVRPPPAVVAGAVGRRRALPDERLRSTG